MFPYFENRLGLINQLCLAKKKEITHYTLTRDPTSRIPQSLYPKISLINDDNMRSFSEMVRDSTGKTLKKFRIHTLQPNITLRCNQECSHCHHNAGPDRNEIMSWETMESIIELSRSDGIEIIDITGGAPEEHPHLRRFISELKGNGRHVMMRTNITNLMRNEHKHLARFFKENEVELIASLPCYEAAEVDCVRGKGVFDSSIEGLQYLNNLGYGKVKELRLNLVFNPMTDFLPPPQAALKLEYKEILKRDFNIDFTDLFTITNMPLGRFLEDLKRKGKDRVYMTLLYDNFNPTTIDNLMCRFQLNIAWDGTIYDCDFNQALSLPVVDGYKKNINDFSPEDLVPREINTADHCYGCTAGAGSSCGGSLVEE